VADVLEGRDVLHVGANVVRAVRAFESDPPGSRSRAAAAADRHGWHLKHLL
jgi:hypothetical protein